MTFPFKSEHQQEGGVRRHLGGRLVAVVVRGQVVPPHVAALGPGDVDLGAVHDDDVAEGIDLARRLIHHRLGGDDAANVLFGVVDQRYLRKRPIILTTNKRLSAWGTVLHDPDLAEVILDRILERGVHLALGGPSWRRRHLPESIEAELREAPETSV